MMSDILKAGYARFYAATPVLLRPLIQGIRRSGCHIVHTLHQVHPKPRLPLGLSRFQVKSVDFTDTEDEVIPGWVELIENYV